MSLPIFRIFCQCKHCTNFNPLFYYWILRFLIIFTDHLSCQHKYERVLKETKRRGGGWRERSVKEEKKGTHSKSRLGEIFNVLIHFFSRFQVRLTPCPPDRSRSRGSDRWWRRWTSGSSGSRSTLTSVTFKVSSTNSNTVTTSYVSKYDIVVIVYNPSIFSIVIAKNAMWTYPEP